MSVTSELSFLFVDKELSWVQYVSKNNRRHFSTLRNNNIL